MGEKIVIGPINRGLRTDRTAFVIDNDAFPKLLNAYQWRGRVKRKRGTEILGRLSRFFDSTDHTYTLSPTIPLTSGSANLLTGFGLETLGNIVPGSVTINDVTLPTTFTDNGQGVLVGGSGGTINYSTGVITINGGGTDLINAVFTYYPSLPAMGLEESILNPTENPVEIAFDTLYAYKISANQPYPITDITFYSNPPSGTYASSYVAKEFYTPFTWNGLDYQQFNTASYFSAFWATNGVQVPFISTNVGMQFAPDNGNTITFASNTATTISITIANCSLVIGDFVFFNEWTSVTPANASKLNLQSGYVTSCTPNTSALALKTITITLPNANLPTDTYAPGIIQYLTNSSNPDLDCIRYYDGNGWVNFMPPLSQGAYAFQGERLNKYYLVGAKIVYAFGNSLIFFGPVVQTSGGTKLYLPATATFCLPNGTPYYTASYAVSNNQISNIIPILTPDDETSFPYNWFEDQTGFGGSINPGLNQAIATVAPNSNALMVGFNSSTQTRFHGTGNNLAPFEFFLVNSELGSSSTFSSITMDEGVITRGPRGFIMSSQTEARRIDLDILQQPFDISNDNNGTERFTAQRDFQNEWIYFTYVNKGSGYIPEFPNQTLQFNYRDNSWAVFDESYTTYGSFRVVTGYAWETIETNWENLTIPWEDLTSDVLEPQVIAGNQQGYIVFRATQSAGTEEAYQIYINSFNGNQLTSYNHNLVQGDWIQIDNCIGDVGVLVNKRIYQVQNATIDTFTINANPDIPNPVGYSGGGQIRKLFVPVIQTKQFPLDWGDGRKVRLGPQQYLLSTTAQSQITLLMFLSQDSAQAFNDGGVIPDPNTQNDALIYSTVLYTCPESTNLGLTPANTNLQMPTASGQSQIWHRMNTSLLGDTVQLGFTISDDQMSTYSAGTSSFVITDVTKTNPCVITCNNTIPTGALVQMRGIKGPKQLNSGTYTTIATTNSTQVTINFDASNLDPYISGGTIFVVTPVFQTAEVELHSIVLDVSPSGYLA